MNSEYFACLHRIKDYQESFKQILQRYIEEAKSRRVAATQEEIRHHDELGLTINYLHNLSEMIGHLRVEIDSLWDEMDEDDE